jgi:hypothetical protein
MAKQPDPLGRRFLLALREFTAMVERGDEFVRLLVGAASGALTLSQRRWP